VAVVLSVQPGVWGLGRRRFKIDFFLLSQGPSKAGFLERKPSLFERAEHPQGFPHPAVLFRYWSILEHFQILSASFVAFHITFRFCLLGLRR
jgi:hypothetical protein